MEGIESRRTAYAWRCQECGHRFPNGKAAERAAFGDNGCPGCGGSDVDYSLPVVPQTPRESIERANRAGLV